METLHFSIFINAPKEKVWNTMLEDETYREWTSEFHEGSYYTGDWNEGSDIKFLAPDEDGGFSGLYGTIRESRTYDFVSVEYYGGIEKGIEATGEDIIWAGAKESYTFVEKDGGTNLIIDMDVTEDDKPYMQDMWPKALKKLKEIIE